MAVSSIASLASFSVGAADVKRVVIVKIIYYQLCIRIAPEVYVKFVHVQSFGTIIYKRTVPPVFKSGRLYNN